MAAERCNHCRARGINPPGVRANLGVSMFRGGRVYWKTGCSRCGTVDWEYLPPEKVDLDNPGLFGQHAWLNPTPELLRREGRRVHV